MLSAELLARQRLAAQRLFRGRSILAAYAYGSRVSGRPRADSDLDVGYYLEEYRRGALMPVHEEMLLAAELSEATGVRVDLRNLAEAPLELRGRVLEDGVRVYSGNDADRVALERELLGRYHDYKEVFRQMHQMRLREVARRGL